MWESKIHLLNTHAFSYSFLTCSFLPLPHLSFYNFSNAKPHTKQCAPSDIDKINLSLYMPNNFVLALPVRKKCVSVFMGLRVCLLFCHTTYYVCLNLRVFISLTRKNNCMFTNIKEKKFWTGPVSKVAHIQKLCTAAGSNCCCMNLYLNIMGMARYENIEIIFTFNTTSLYNKSIRRKIKLNSCSFYVILNLLLIYKTSHTMLYSASPI